ncbi:tyrosine-type recombinase/integrase [Aestuariivirga sp.]|jgi:integrase|uniref:tyrosine-type recombinase/integrase n=1 Tax=Aestuariivirga sp. TaxID=2650926 RepID=UPI0037843EB6
MPKDRVINSQSFQDGKIVLYQLENRPKQLWLCRLKVPNGTGYLYRGTGTSDFYEARKFADNLYDELRFKVRSGQSVTGQDFKKIFAEFTESYPREAASEKRAAAVCEFIRCYALPYFSKMKITELTEPELTKFFDWRRVNYKKKPPTNATIVSDQGRFKVFTNWCFRRGYITKQIQFRKPSVPDNRRPHFDGKDWARLTRFLREWVKGADGKSGAIYRERVMLTNYVLILANTGIRVGEARTLKWSDIDTFIGDDGKENIVLQVKGKTGAREVVSRTPDVLIYLQRIHELRTKESSGEKPPMTEPIFAHKDGTPIHSFKKGFNSLIKEAGVEYDTNGQRRVIYSLRHTYATFRLQEGVNHYVLARNMGTSVKMLENFYGHTSNRAMASELTKTRSKDRKKLPWEE